MNHSAPLAHSPADSMLVLRPNALRCLTLGLLALAGLLAQPSDCAAQDSSRDWSRTHNFNGPPGLCAKNGGDDGEEPPRPQEGVNGCILPADGPVAITDGRAFLKPAADGGFPDLLVEMDIRFPNDPTSVQHFAAPIFKWSPDDTLREYAVTDTPYPCSTLSMNEDDTHVRCTIPGSKRYMPPLVEGSYWVRVAARVGYFPIVGYEASDIFYVDFSKVGAIVDFDVIPMGAPGRYQFVSNATSPGGAAFTVRWELSDGTTSSDTSFIHQFALPGTYDVTLIADDDGAVLTSKTKQVEVAAPELRITITFPDADDLQFDAGEQFTARLSISAGSEGLGPLTQIGFVDAPLNLVPAGWMNTTGPSPPITGAQTLQPGETKHFDWPIFVADVRGIGTLRAGANAFDAAGGLVESKPKPIERRVKLGEPLLTVAVVEVSDPVNIPEGENPAPQTIEVNVVIGNPLAVPVEDVVLDPILLIEAASGEANSTLRLVQTFPDPATADPIELGTLAAGQVTMRTFFLSALDDGALDVSALVGSSNPFWPGPGPSPTVATQDTTRIRIGGRELSLTLDVGQELVKTADGSLALNDDSEPVFKPLKTILIGEWFYVFGQLVNETTDKVIVLTDTELEVSEGFGSISDPVLMNTDALTPTCGRALPVELEPGDDVNFFVRVVSGDTPGGQNAPPRLTAKLEFKGIAIDAEGTQKNVTTDPQEISMPVTFSSGPSNRSLGGHFTEGAERQIADAFQSLATLNGEAWILIGTDSGQDQIATKTLDALNYATAWWSTVPWNEKKELAKEFATGSVSDFVAQMNAEAEDLGHAVGAGKYEVLAEKAGTVLPGTALSVFLCGCRAAAFRKGAVKDREFRLHPSEIYRDPQAALERLRAGDLLDTRRLRAVLGISQRDVADFADVAKEFDIIIAMRRRHPRSIQLEAAGALPKPEKIKIKTVNDYDWMYLGYRETDLAKVVFRKPTRPNYANVPIGEVKAIRTRYKQRLAEYKSEKAKMDRFEADGVDLSFNYRANNAGANPPPAHARLDIDENGVVRIDDRLVTGDTDLVDIRHADGRPITSPALRRQIYRRMNEKTRSQHGDTTAWEKDGVKIFDTKLDLLSKHDVDGEALVQIAPDGSARACFLDSKASYFDGAGNYRAAFVGGYEHSKAAAVP